MASAVLSESCGVGLVANVPDQTVIRRVEDEVQHNCQLHHMSPRQNDLLTCLRYRAGRPSIRWPAGWSWSAGDFRRSEGALTLSNTGVLGVNMESRGKHEVDASMLWLAYFQLRDYKNKLTIKVKNSVMSDRGTALMCSLCHMGYRNLPDREFPGLHPLCKGAMGFEHDICQRFCLAPPSPMKLAVRFVAGRIPFRRSY